ncbi:MAG: HAMP domain-containing protein [Deltaproteobacteria bacterium]|nr:HAMP domain-containing protein [Deltaproteobacteria bacterium]MBW2400235.1 HAMP domain-containing protein [Deltaproteobacteria bacterium]MBW2664772.1 HAMP domain-containing protein [Deltaproteobacteria bacterium]
MNTQNSSTQSLNRKLTGTVFFVTVSTLVIACSVFLALDWLATRSSIARNTGTLADVVGINSVVSLTFYDTVTAGENLAALSAAGPVDAAVIYDAEGRPFASYVSDSVAGHFQPPPAPAIGQKFGSKGLELAHEISYNGEQVGTIYILSNTAELVNRARLYAITIAMLLLAVTGVTAFISARLRRVVTKPLTDLADASAAIASGNLAIEVPVTTNDEIGALARSFNSMTASLRTIVKQAMNSVREIGDVTSLLTENGKTVAVESQRQSVAIDETAESIEQLSASIRGVSANVEQVSDSARETSSSIIEMDASTVSVAEHMDHLAETIDATSACVIQVASGTDQVVSGVSVLTAAADGAMERLTDLRRSVQHVTENAKKSQTLCDDTNQEAEQGIAAVNETIAAINEISKSFGDLEQRVSRLADNSTAIGEILLVIRAVAEQTAMLSLNAAIIAAQAGEQGKAFSVVADEVSNLAGRTHRSTQEIATLVQAVQDDTAAAVEAAEEGAAKVKTGVQRSNVAGKVLAMISEKSTSSLEMVGAIAEASMHQGRDLERVEGAMSEVGTIVTQINRSTLDQQAATGEIAKAVDNIRSLGTGVRASTEEQRRGSRLITESVTHVAGMIEEIVSTTQAQGKSGETIAHSLQVFRDVARESTRRAEDLATMVETLSERSSRLEEVVGRFKL